MNRTIACVLVVSFALFAGSPAMADMILSSAGGASSEAVSDVAAKAGDLAAKPALDGAEVLSAGPDQVQQVASIEMVGIIALVVLLGSVYYFGATDHPSPGW
jgi:hypothetical protein